MLSVGGILLILTNMQVSVPGTLTPTRWPGHPAWCWGGPDGVCGVSLCQVGNLFGKYRSIIITLYNGAFDSSSAIFLIIKVGAGWGGTWWCWGGGAGWPQVPVPVPSTTGGGWG